MRKLLLVIALLVGQAGLFAIAPQSVQAQVVPSEKSYAEWNVLASSSEAALREGGGSDGLLVELRAEIVQWRSHFQQAQNADSARIGTVSRQLEALGPLPPEGTDEAPEIQARRSELQTQLALLQAPELRASEAYSRADGIVREIDAVFREREANQLSELGPSPLNFVYWPNAFREMIETGKAAATEIPQAWDEIGFRPDFAKGVTLTILYLIVAFVLLWRGRSWMETLTRRIQRHSARAADSLVGFLVSLGQVLVPVVGVFALANALLASELFGLRGQILIETLPDFGIAIFGARWLSVRLFPKYDDTPGFLEMPAKCKSEMRLYSTLLGFLLGLSILIDRFVAYENYSDEVRAVLYFPVFALAGVFLYRSSQILKTNNTTWTDDARASEAQSGLLTQILWVVIFVSVVGPIAAAIGFFAIAKVLVFPSVVSLWLLGVLVLLNGVVRDIYGLVTKVDETSAQEALVPVLINFAMFLVSLPLFALLWGARVSDLEELWTRFQEGITFGDSQIQPSDFLTFAAVFLLLYGLTRILQKTLKTTILPKTKMDIGGRTAVVSGVGYVGLFLAAVAAVSTAGIDLSNLAIVAGALSVGIGFGLQTIVSNFVSGIILLVERPISEGDWIEVGGQMGYVRDISVRATRIETFDRTDVIVPNSDLISGTVTNYTRGNLIGRAIVPVGVAYGTDTRKVSTILSEIAEAHPLVAMNPPPTIVFRGFGDSSLDFEIRAILRDVNFVLSVKTELNHEIARRFAHEGIEIPFPQRDVWLRNGDTSKPETAD